MQTNDYCYIIKEWFFYFNHFSLIIFYHSIWLGFELFGLRVQMHSHWVHFLRSRVKDMAITIVIINLRQKMGQECGWRYIQKRWAENLRILKNTAVESSDWTMGDDGWVLPLEQRVEFSNVAAAVKFFGSLPAEMNWDLKHHEMCRMFGVGV